MSISTSHYDDVIEHWKAVIEAAKRRHEETGINQVQIFSGRHDRAEDESAVISNDVDTMVVVNGTPVGLIEHVKFEIGRESPLPKVTLTLFAEVDIDVESGGEELEREARPPT